MARTAAKVTQADVARVLRAAKQAGIGRVEVRPDGTIVVLLDTPPISEAAIEPLHSEAVEGEVEADKVIVF